jgi:hypothetical protein
MKLRSPQDIAEYSHALYLPEFDSTMPLTNHSDSRSDEEIKHPEGAHVAISQKHPTDRDEERDVPLEVAPMGTKKALIAWLILCYSVGP